MLRSDVFYNRQKPGRDELFSYMPKYWQEIAEMQAINEFGGYTLDSMATALEQLILDQFFDTCSEEMLNRYESFLGITGYASRSLDERRNIVKVTWIGNIKMSRSQIKSLVKAYCGCDSDVHFTHEVTIVAKISESTSNIYIGDLLYIFNAQIPAHLMWEAIMDLDSKSITAGRSICYWLYDYTKCGTNPDVSTLGAAIETDYQVETDTQNYVYEYDDTAELVSGTNPSTAVIGSVVNTKFAVNTSSETHSYEYDKTGEDECGTTPTVATIGFADKSIISAEATADSYKYDAQKTGSKICGEEDN